jgi:aminoglycoside 6'-N-acetyltransferase
MNDCALIVIDMQRSLFQKKLYNSEQLIANINLLLAGFHRVNKPVFLFRHANGSFLKSGNNDWQIHAALQQTESDIVLDKTHSSVFKETVFTNLLTSKKIRSIVITGLVSNGCIKVACTDAKNLGIKTTLVSDGHSTWHKDAENIIAECNTNMAKIGIRVLPTHEVLHETECQVKF